MNPWLYQCSPLTIIPDKAVGFVYLITCDTPDPGKPYLYVGKKSFWSWRKKGRIRKRVESDWRKYFGSSVHVQADVDRLGYDAFTRDITRICFSKWEMNYYEVKAQMDADVLLNPDVYYNRNVLRALFTPRSRG